MKVAMPGLIATLAISTSMAGEIVKTKDGTELFTEIRGSGDQTVIVMNAVYYEKLLATLGPNHRAVLYDLRNRGRSASITEDSRLTGGIENDVSDLDEVRRWSGAEKVTIVAHSYNGLVAAVFAGRNPGVVERLVLIDPMAATPLRAYPAELTRKASPPTPDDIKRITEAKSGDAQAYCRVVWEIALRAQVFDPRNASRAYPDVCHLPNEHPDAVGRMMRVFIGGSLARLKLGKRDLQSITAPVLIVQGMEDQVVPFGAALEWGHALPQARVLRIPAAGHAPWADDPERVLPAIRNFLAGRWPEDAERVERLPFESAIP